MLLGSGNGFIVSNSADSDPGSQRKLPHSKGSGHFVLLLVAAAFVLVAGAKGGRRGGILSVSDFGGGQGRAVAFGLSSETPIGPAFVTPTSTWASNGIEMFSVFSAKLNSILTELLT